MVGLYWAENHFKFCPQNSKDYTQLIIEVTNMEISDKVLIAAYGLCHPEWSRSMIRLAIRKEHDKIVKILFKSQILFN